MSDKTYIGRNVSDFEAHIGFDVSSLEESPAFPPYSKVILWVDEETAFISGDDSGRTMEATLPWANQAIADEVLAKINGFVYCPFSATDANVNPAVELGDGASVAGIYAPLAIMTTVFDALYTAEISAPYDEEIDHEYPYVSPTTRELRRKVSLGKSYYGTRITRANGLEVVKTEADGTEKSRVKLNSDILAFYNDDGEEALYFDAAAGKYRFRGDVEVTGGSMNINDNFIVDEDGNVQLNGSITIAGSLTMTGESNWVQVRYSTDSAAAVPSGWTEEWDSDWSNTSTQVWAIYSYDGGSAWTKPMLVQGKTGDPGSPGKDGSDATVPAWVKAYTASAEYNTLVSDEWVVSMNLYGSKIYGGRFYNLSGDHWIEIGDDDGACGLTLTDYAHQDVGGIFSIYNGDFGWISLRAKNGYAFASIDGYEQLFEAKGTWDFSSATVSGLDIVFG